MATTTLTGTTGNDTLNAPGLVATEVVGLAGNDTITLSRGDDEVSSGAGNDLITLDNNIAASNVINAGTGSDTVRILSSVSFNGNVGFGAGNDSIFLTAGLLNGGTLRGNEGADTIRIQIQSVNSFIGAGQGGDTIVFEDNSNQTNTTVFGGKGADTLRIDGAGTYAQTTIQASDGHDKLRVTAAAVFNTNSVLAMGKGADSLYIAANAAFVTVAGGGLDDTITMLSGAALQRGIIFGDGIGAVTASDKTGGAADGNDRLDLTGATFASAVSVIGGGGNDTIRFAAAAYANGTSAVSINGGDGNDLIGQSGVSFAGVSAGSTLTGGAGNDTIRMALAGGGMQVLGAAGDDSIFMGTAIGNATSIIGGAGKDTITYRGSEGQGDTQAGTINGGAGVDKVSSPTPHIGCYCSNPPYCWSFSALLGNLAAFDDAGDFFAILRSALVLLLPLTSLVVVVRSEF